MALDKAKNLERLAATPLVDSTLPVSRLRLPISIFWI